MKKLAGNKCQKCGFSSTTLETHHLNYKNFGREKMSDLIVLCKPCHAEADEKRVRDKLAEIDDRIDRNAFGTWMTKRNGAGSEFYATEHDRANFEEWIERKREQEWR